MRELDFPFYADPAMTFQQVAEVGQFVRRGQAYADALIEIAADFEEDRCGHCEVPVTSRMGCWDGCPGLLARRALGVA